MSFSPAKELSLVREIFQEAKNFFKSTFNLLKTGPLELPDSKNISYAIVLFYSEEDRCWVADVPDLKYCSAFGHTPEEAAKEIQVALAGWLEGAHKKGIRIPRPSFDPRHLNMQGDRSNRLADSANAVAAAEGEQLSLDDALDREGAEQTEHEYA